MKNYIDEEFLKKIGKERNLHRWHAKAPILLEDVTLDIIQFFSFSNERTST